MAAWNENERSGAERFALCSAEEPEGNIPAIAAAIRIMETTRNWEYREAKRKVKFLSIDTGVGKSRLCVT